MKFFKKMLAFVLTLACCFSVSTTVFAAEPNAEIPNSIGKVEEATIEPRVGIAGYRNYYHDGSKVRGSYEISTDSIVLPRKQVTIELADFESTSWIIVEIYNSSNNLMYTLDVNGNGKWENKPLNSVYYTNGDTYRIEYQVFNPNTSISEDGWIGIWFF